MGVGVADDLVGVGVAEDFVGFGALVEVVAPPPPLPDDSRAMT